MMLRSTVPLLFLLVLSGSDRELIYHTVREGDDVTLSCENDLTDQNQCQFTNWTLYKIPQKQDLVISGQKQDGVSSSVKILQNCSLVSHSVTVEEAGIYHCVRHVNNTREASINYLFVASLLQQQDKDRVNLTCSVRPERLLHHEVKWLNNDKEVTEDHPELQLFPSRRFDYDVTVSFKNQTPPSQFYQTLKCRVKNRFSEQIIFLSPPVDKSSDAAVTVTTDRASPSAVTVGSSKTTPHTGRVDQSSDVTEEAPRSGHSAGSDGASVTVTVTEGDDVTLECHYVRPEDHTLCPKTRWTKFPRAELRARHGRIAEGMTLLQNCSLVLHRVTLEQAGQYKCQEFSRGVTDVYLTVQPSDGGSPPETPGGGDTVAEPGSVSLTVTEGDDATLVCHYVRSEDHTLCPKTRWTKEPRVELRARHGRIAEGMTLLQNCSLVLHRVTLEQAGQYKCQEFSRGVTDVYLTVQPSDGGSPPERPGGGDTAAEPGSVSLTVTEGDDATLVCHYVRPEDHTLCPKTRWTKEPRVELRARHGAIAEGMTLLQNCSLVLHKVTLEQAGWYKCCEFSRGVTDVHLTVQPMSPSGGSPTDGSPSEEDTGGQPPSSATVGPSEETPDDTSGVEAKRNNVIVNRSGAVPV